MDRKESMGELRNVVLEIYIKDQWVEYREKDKLPGNGERKENYQPHFESRSITAERGEKKRKRPRGKRRILSLHNINERTSCQIRNLKKDRNKVPPTDIQNLSHSRLLNHALKARQYLLVRGLRQQAVGEASAGGAQHGASLHRVREGYR